MFVKPLPSGHQIHLTWILPTTISEAYYSRNSVTLKSHAEINQQK